MVHSGLGHNSLAPETLPRRASIRWSFLEPSRFHLRCRSRASGLSVQPPRNRPGWPRCPRPRPALEVRTRIHRRSRHRLQSTVDVGGRSPELIGDDLQRFWGGPDTHGHSTKKTSLQLAQSPISLTPTSSGSAAAADPASTGPASTLPKLQLIKAHCNMVQIDHSDQGIKV